MKKTIILSSVFLLMAVLNQSFGRTAHDSATVVPAAIKTLIVNADVSVVLVDNDQANLEVTGRHSLRDIVSFKQSGDTLFIATTKKRDVKGAGVIYVPASHLQTIRVNSQANVTTAYPLLAPKVDVVINGECTVSIASIGKVNMTSSPSFIVDETRETHSLPASVFNRLRSYY